METNGTAKSVIRNWSFSLMYNQIIEIMKKKASTFKTDLPSSHIKIELIHVITELKQKKGKANEGKYGVIPYPKDTFLRAYDPLESL